MAKFCPLFSGSTGNCTYIGSSDGGILIDVGVSAKKVVTSLTDLDIPLETIKAIFVTHEHSDHASGIRVLASKLKIPVYASEGTLEGLESYYSAKDNIDSIVINAPVEAAGMLITQFKTSHDSRESCGYIINAGERSLAVCTDLGYVSEEVRQAITGCDLVMLESNHDVRMLQNGSYPYYLKCRVLGERGHLSNSACSDELVKLVENGSTRLILGHLSRENNMPVLALETARVCLNSAGMKEGTDYIISTAPVFGGKIIAL